MSSREKQCYHGIMVHALTIISIFRIFGNERFMNMMKTVMGENEFSNSLIANLKACVNAEHNAFIKSIKQMVLEHCEEGHQDRFYQFTRGRLTLKNEDKHQAMVKQRASEEPKHDDVIALRFRKLESRMPKKVAELSQEVINEVFGAEFADMFS